MTMNFKVGDKVRVETSPGNWLVGEVGGLYAGGEVVQVVSGSTRNLIPRGDVRHRIGEDAAPTRARDNPPRGVIAADGPEEHTREVVRRLANGLIDSGAIGPMTATLTETSGDYEITYAVTIGGG